MEVKEAAELDFLLIPERTKNISGKKGIRR
jgi:hypothetical protein